MPILARWYPVGCHASCCCQWVVLLSSGSNPLARALSSCRVLWLLAFCAFHVLLRVPVLLFMCKPHCSAAVRWRRVTWSRCSLSVIRRCHTIHLLGEGHFALSYSKTQLLLWRVLDAGRISGIFCNHTYISLPLKTNWTTISMDTVDLSYSPRVVSPEETTVAASTELGPLVHQFCHLSTHSPIFSDQS